jgi:hypothetical protein
MINALVDAKRCLHVVVGLAALLFSAHLSSVAQIPARPPNPPAKTTPSGQAGARPIRGQTPKVTTSHVPANAIRTLAVRVVTGAAGSCDQVWFSIGPLGWKLDNPHRNSGDSHAGCGQLSIHCADEARKHAEHEAERQAKGLCMFAPGADDTYELPIPTGLQPPYLTTDDIVLVGLQKKGVGGLYGAPDTPPGDWGPHQVTLLVNGAPYPNRSCCIVGQRLHHGNATWVQVLKPYFPEEVFVRSLRLIPNPPLDKMSEDVAFLTTKFGKDRGISGWLAQPIPPTCAVGTVIRSPGISNDGLATIDLSVDKIETTRTSLYIPPHAAQGVPDTSPLLRPGQQLEKALAGAVPKTEAVEYILDGQHGIPGARYLRVEYAFHGNPVPKNQDHVRICGEVYRDTDYESWFEIHPRDASDVAVLSPGSSTTAGGTPLGPVATGKTGQPFGPTGSSPNPPANGKALVIVVEEDQAQTYSVKRADFFKALGKIFNFGLDDLQLDLPPELRVAARDIGQVRDDLLSAVRNGYKQMLTEAIRAEQGAVGGSPPHNCFTDMLGVLSQSIVLGPQPGRVFLDHYGEPIYANCFRDMAAPYYEKVVVLTDVPASYANFKSTLEQLNQQRFSIDLLLDIHGCGNSSVLNNGHCWQDELLMANNTPNYEVTPSMISQINNGNPMNLNAVYMVSCWGSRFNDTWLRMGAKASNGSRELNYYVLLSPFVFMHYWTEGGMPLAQAASKGYDFERVLLNGKTYDIRFNWRDPLTGQTHTVEKISIGLTWEKLMNKALAQIYAEDKRKPVDNVASSARIPSGNPVIRR